MWSRSVRMVACDTGKEDSGKGKVRKKRTLLFPRRKRPKITHQHISLHHHTLAPVHSNLPLKCHCPQNKTHLHSPSVHGNTPSKSTHPKLPNPVNKPACTRGHDRRVVHHHDKIVNSIGLWCMSCSWSNVLVVTLRD